MTLHQHDRTLTTYLDALGVEVVMTVCTNNTFVEGLIVLMDIVFRGNQQYPYTLLLHYSICVTACSEVLLGCEGFIFVFDISTLDNPS